jgi:glycosyltransferase involved in cell wall biosynthesis
MNRHVDISVVMGVYNGALHLRDTLDSILGQEGVSLEFIIVNDGSSDASPQILEEYASRESRIRVIHQENQGLTRSLIKGCAAARGTYIARQDVGDVSLPQRLYLQKAALDLEADLSLVSGWTEYCGPEWEFLYTIKGAGLAESPTSIISVDAEHGVVDGPTHHGSATFRRSAYEKAGGYRPEFYYGQDWDLWYRLADLGKFQTITRTLYRARLLPNSISAGNKKRQERIAALSLAALRKRRRRLSEQDILDLARRIRPDEQRWGKARSNAPGLYFIGECLRRNDDTRALAYFNQSLKESPLFIKSWVRIFQAKLNLSLSRPK